MAEGSFFTSAQVNDAADVAVIGSTTTQELGLGAFPLGQAITINNVSLTIIGELNTAGDSSGIDEDDMVLVPITVAQSLITGSQSVQSIYVEAHQQGALGAAV